MFKKILIANRGEIACRVIRTARRMGIKTVAVYSEADKDALHVARADEAVPIGPAPSAQSYLVIDRIIEACKQTGAEAVHPGYGFLSENEAFARALEKAAIAFIGPNVEAIAGMGDKIASKKLAEKAKVNTIPGYTDVIRDAAQAVEIARKIRYPVMIKASAGGGGKGLRVARSDAEAREGFVSCQNEARAAFGDDRVFIEKFIEEPRHIEVQVLGDAHGTVVYLWERECSIQRRHQKVLEEAPSPFLDEAARHAMGKQAVALAKAVKYRSAGTVEFVVGADRSFYFLEMNTRLQVEHPVTEMITGFDLVELMIRVAAGERLPFGQDDIPLRGWAIEARINAEDPSRGFLPSTGRLVQFRPPAERAGELRVDTGVFEGGEVSMYYDSMIAKLIAHGTARDEARARLAEALDSFVVKGPASNIAFLSAVSRHPRFASGKFNTGFIAEEFPQGYAPSAAPIEDPSLFVSVAAAVHWRYAERSARIAGQVPGHERDVGDARVVHLRGAVYPVRVRSIPGGQEVFFDGNSFAVLSGWKLGEPVFAGTLNGKRINVRLERNGMKYRLMHAGAEVTVLVLTEHAAKMQALMPEKPPPDLSKFLLSPMPGLLTELAVNPGQEIKAGEKLAVIEAMKMENVLRAENDAVVKKLLAKAGDSLAVDQPIVEFQ
ncbi:MAG TPA: acetyl/propionyl/methylcrotonyl-CoA carboxylase subunit alpha [Burkholderiales bacterium]|nr:acetyl/propionyl/methylcrotonyl-CoA carboxylase subunit alpha [Burkholderiales bacterium]